ncbi:MAG: hypothetical protein U0X20_29960 [Caldilineaceae bacterium]
MFNVLFYRLLLFMLLFAGSTTVVTPPTPTPPSDPAENIGVPEGEPFALKWGHPGAVGDTGIIVMFDGIVVDPRCPEGVSCTYDAPVAAEFTVSGGGGAPAHIVLTAHTDPEGNVLPPGDDVVVADTAHGYTVTLLKVLPYPQAKDVTPAGDYQVWLRVDPAVEPVPSSSAAVGTPFTLAPGGTIALDDTDMMVGLLSVADTRCPIDLDCGTGGSNGVEVGVLVLNQYGETEQLALSGRTGYDGLVLPPTGKMQPQAAFGDYTLKLLRVMPFPKGANEVAPKDYRVTLVVDGPGSAPTPAAPEPPSGDEVALAEPFDLHLHDKVAVAGEGLEIEFTGIQTDSRCPSDVMCAWSGVAGLQFTATAPSGAAGDFVLGGYADPEGVVRPVMEAGVAPIAVQGDYLITITHIRPYPAHHDQTIAPEEYVATLVVTTRK